MIIWLCLRWWYGAGWQWAFQRAVIDRLNWCMQMFSMTTLLRTWFAPFKQVYTGNVKGSIGTHIRVFVDNIVSRIIGFLVRTIILIAGLICSIFVLVTGLAFLVVWAFIPPLPFIALLLYFGKVGV